MVLPWERRERDTTHGFRYTRQQQMHNHVAQQRGRFEWPTLCLLLQSIATYRRLLLLLLLLKA